MSTPLRVSRALAWIIGAVTPALELARRWHEVTTMTVYWPSLLDDFLLGGFLLYGAWSVGRDSRSGRAILAAAGDPQLFVAITN